MPKLRLAILNPEDTHMPKMLCIANCQYPCVTRKGTILDIPAKDMALDIVKQNFVASGQPETPPALDFDTKNPLKNSKETAGFATGTPLKVADPNQAGANAGTTNGAPDPNQKPEGHQAPTGEKGTDGVSGQEKLPPPPFAAMPDKDLAAWLDANGVKYNPKMKQSELVKLAEQAYALISKGE